MRLIDYFRSRLREACHNNVDGFWYVPRRIIAELTDRHTISGIILENGFLDDGLDTALANAQRDSQIDKIHKQAKITFAISCHVEHDCIHRILGVIKYAEAKGSEVDNRLPFSIRELGLGGFADDEADRFFKAQWHFVAPKIQLGTFVPTEFIPNIILPLRLPQVEQRHPPDTGAFGTVKEVCVEEGHQVEPAYSGRIVRKQFHSKTPKKFFLTELRNLCILSSARNDSIVQLLGAYTQENSFNLIFPLVSSGNLDQLFHSNSPSLWPIMASEESIVMALSGLASALVTMHEFTTQDIQMIGCHRDLKPANILVDDKRLLLADFGLSRIVDTKESSSSTAPNTVGDFIAPEHEDRNFTRNPIGRSSDIWAFGCVTLMLLVFMQKGRQGLDELERKRRVEWPNYAHHCFHDYDRLNPGLRDPRHLLASSQSPSVQGLLHLIEKILVLEKKLRPKATAIDAHIRSLILHTWSTSIDEEFGKACKSDYIHVHLQRARFRGWRSAVKISDSAFLALKEGSGLPNLGNFQSVIEHLQELHNLLKRFTDGRFSQESKAFLPVKSRIDHLLGALDKEARTAALAHTECMMLESKKLSWLRELQRLSEEAMDRRTENKAATRMQILRPTMSERLYVHFTNLEPRPDMTKISKVRIVSNKGPEPDLVLAEEAHTFKRLQKSPTSIHNPQRTPSRLQEAANLLATCRENESFRVLVCRGYYYQPTELRSGLLYEIPRSLNNQTQGIMTLHDIISSQTTPWCLGDRFHLARGLATAIYELHSVSWLHRNVSASNITFFYSDTKCNIDTKSFYFVGFAQSRADRDFTDSDGAPSEIYDEEYYQHPEYLSRDQGYQMYHDYHALGMLLLEIGLWKLFPDAVSGRTVNCASTSAKQELVPQLGWMTGSFYRDAVDACLNGTLSDASLAQQGQKKLPLVFRAQVVERLSSNHCRA